MSPHTHTAGPVFLSLTGPMYLHMLFVHTVWNTTPLPIGPLIPSWQHFLLQAPSVPTATTTVLRELRLVSEEPPHVFMRLSLSPELWFPCKSWDPWSPHLEPPPVSTKDSRQQPTGPSGSKEEGVTSPCCTGHPSRSAVAVGCQEGESNLPGYLTPAAEAPASVG